MNKRRKFLLFLSIKAVVIIDVRRLRPIMLQQGQLVIDIGHVFLCVRQRVMHIGTSIFFRHLRVAQFGDAALQAFLPAYEQGDFGVQSSEAIGAFLCDELLCGDSDGSGALCRW